MRACEAVQRMRKSRSTVDLGEQLQQKYQQAQHQQAEKRRRRRHRPATSGGFSRSTPVLPTLGGDLLSTFNITRQMDLVSLSGCSFQRTVPSPFSDTVDAKAFYDKATPFSVDSTTKQSNPKPNTHRQKPRKPGASTCAEDVPCTTALAKLCITEFKAALQDLGSSIADPTTPVANSKPHTNREPKAHTNRTLGSLSDDIWAIIFLFCGTMSIVRSSAAGMGFVAREHVRELRLPIRKPGKQIQLASGLVQRFRNIRVVKLSSLQINDLLAVNISRSLPLSFLQRLHTLDGSYNDMSSKGAAALISQMGSLQTLDLSYNALGEGDTEDEYGDIVSANSTWQLAGLRVQLAGLQQLQVLRLVGNSISNDGLARLAHTLLSLPLVELDLTYNDIDSVEELIRLLPHHERLATLKLGENQLDDAALLEILTGLELLDTPLQLACLDLSENKFTDEGLTMLADRIEAPAGHVVQALTSLDIRGGTCCTPEHQETIQKKVELLLQGRNSSTA
jgi:hypothetical protein